MTLENHLYPMTEDTLVQMKPQDALARLVFGNDRFLVKVSEMSNRPLDPRDFNDFINTTSSKGQFPFALILSCIDSRMPTETLFDQAIGDVFNTRIAGNFVNQDILGGMEFACSGSNAKGEYTGVKLIVVMGHTACGAINGAVQAVHPHCFPPGSPPPIPPNNLIAMLDNLIPAVHATELDIPDGKDCTDEEWQKDFKNRVSDTNVGETIQNIRSRSKMLADLNDNGTIEIVGAMYDIRTGKVTFSRSHGPA